MKFLSVIGPMPDQLVKDNTTDAMVGPHISTRASVSGTPTINAIRILSWRVRSVYRRLRRATSAPASGAFCVRAGATLVVVLATFQMICAYSGGRESQKFCMSFCSLVVSCDGLERNFRRKPCIPFGPAQSGRESRPKQCVIFFAPLTIWTAFLVSAGYWLVSAAVGVGGDP